MSAAVTAAAQIGAVGPLDQRRDGRGIAGVVDYRLGQPVDRQGLRARGDDSFDVGRIAGFQAPDEGVLADRTLGQKLFRRRAAHGAGYRGDDDVVDLQPVEDALVGLAVWW